MFTPDCSVEIQRTFDNAAKMFLLIGIVAGFALSFVARAITHAQRSIDRRASQRERTQQSQSS